MLCLCICTSQGGLSPVHCPGACTQEHFQPWAESPHCPQWPVSRTQHVWLDPCMLTGHMDLASREALPRPQPGVGKAPPVIDLLPRPAELQQQQHVQLRPYSEMPLGTRAPGSSSPTPAPAGMPQLGGEPALPILPPTHPPQDLQQAWRHLMMYAQVS